MLDYEICPMTTETEMKEKGYVHWKAWQETYAGLMPDEYLKRVSLENCVKMARKHPQNTLLLKVDCKTVGFCCFRKSEDAEKSYEIVAIYLLKEYQGKRLGYALLKRALSMLPRDSDIVLWVLEGNDKAISFYKKIGFDFNGKEKSLPFGTERQMEWKYEKQASESAKNQR